MKNKLLIPLLIIFLSGCFANFKDNEIKEEIDIQTAQTGDAFITANLSDASYLNPILASDSASNEINAKIFNGLLKYDKDLKIVGDLAESYEIKNDGLEIIFYLRKNVKWHDGKPFTAQDVKFTYEALINPDTKTPFSSNYLSVNNFKIIDDYTIEVSYSKAFALNLESWLMQIIPKHIFEGQNINTAEANRKPIGTGPYKFKSWTTDQQIVLEANDDYFEGRPFIDRYIVKIVPDQAVQFLELQNQSLDSVALTPDQWGAYDSFFKNYNKYRESVFTFTFLGFNKKIKPFDDKNFIKAIEYAINKKDIIDGVLLGTGVQASGPYPPQSWAYNPNIKKSVYNPKKALKILQSIGFEDVNNDGYLEYLNNSFEFTITTNQGNKQRELVAQIIQEHLKKIGLKVNIRIIEFSTFINQYIAQRDFDAVIMGWNLTLDPDQYCLWHSSQILQRQYNFLSYKNDEVDYLLECARETFNFEERKEMYYEIQEIMRDDPPCVFLYFPDSLIAIHKRFCGIQPAPAGIGYNFIEWWVPKKLIKYGFEG